MTTPADPQVSGQPTDPNAAGYVPPSTSTPGSTRVDPYAPVANDQDPETPVRPAGENTLSDTEAEPGGPSGGIVVPSDLEATGHAAPAQGGDESAAAPGTLPTGGDNIATAYAASNPGGPSLPAGETQDPETPVRSAGSINQAPYLTSSVGQEPAGH